MDERKHLSRREFVGSLTGLGAGAILLGKATAGEGETRQYKRPPTTSRKLQDIQLSKPNGLNLIVIISDTFRWDYLHFNGNDRIKTPNLDALAAEGVYFANCYADGLPTIPARRVMHTGKSILPERVKWHPLWEDDITLAEVLGKAGFTTGFIVDTYHHFKPNMNFHLAFDSFQWIRGQENDKYKSGPRNSVNPADYTWPHLLNNNERFRERIIQYVLNTKDRKSEKDYFCAQTLDASVKWLQENKDNDGPFMLFIDMFDPHEPWDAPPRFQKMYRKKYPFERTIFGYGVRHEDIRKEDIPILIDLYSAEVTFMDHCIGEFIKEVKRMGLWDNSIIVFSTDHGTHLGEEGCVQKTPGLLNSCVARIPLIIRHPDKRHAGKRIDALTSHLDFMPTFLSLLGVEGYNDMAGKDLWPLVTGEKKKLRDHTVIGFNNFGAVRTEKWHYFQKVWGKDPGHGPALYDLENDYAELHNVSDKHPDVVSKMKKIMQKAFKTEIS